MTLRRIRAALWGLAFALLAMSIGTTFWTWFTQTSRTGQTESTEQTGSLETLGVYGRVPDFSLVERSGRTVMLADLRGKVWVATFIYTRCTETCPTQSLQLFRLQGDFAAEPDLRLVSITVDPEHDTPEVLAQYARRYKADPERWLFLTGARPVIYALARDGFKLSVVDPDDSQQTGGLLRFLGPRAAYATHGSGGLIIHGSRLVLVDRQGRIRAYHRPGDQESLARLRENVRVLLAEQVG